MLPTELATVAVPWLAVFSGDSASVKTRVAALLNALLIVHAPRIPPTQTMIPMILKAMTMTATTRFKVCMA
jgi:hypothetical protein